MGPKVEYNDFKVMYLGISLTSSGPVMVIFHYLD